MVVLARPRDGDSGDVTLEEDDVIEYVLEKPYGEVLGCTLDSSTLNRSLSARVRRRERVRDEFISVSLHIKWIISDRDSVGFKFFYCSIRLSDLNKIN